MVKLSILALMLSISINNNYLNTDICDHSILVNKQNSISQEYKRDLKIPNIMFLSQGNIEKNHMEICASYALEEMFENAKNQNINLIAVSGYRSYDRQVTIYNNNIKKYGQEYTDTVSAKPGMSEHQTGLAMDISSKSNNYNLTQQFENTPEGVWLKENSYKYGFIIRYPKGKESITGYSYEPWHVRYVGKDFAKFLHTYDLTLEEYYKLHNNIYNSSLFFINPILKLKLINKLM